MKWVIFYPIHVYVYKLSHGNILESVDVLPLSIKGACSHYKLRYFAILDSFVIQQVTE